MSRSEQEIQALLDSTKTQLRLESSARVVTAQTEAERARKEYLEMRANVIRPFVVEVIKRERPDLDYESAIGLICNWIIDHKYPITDTSVHVAIAQGVAQPKPPLQGQELRDDLERQIMELLVASPEEKERERQSYHSRASASRKEITSRQKTGAFLVTTESMRIRLQNLKLSQEKRELSHSELVNEVRGMRKLDAYPPLPAKFSRDYVKFVMSGEDLQNLIKRYGQAQIDQRLAEGV